MFYLRLQVCRHLLHFWLTGVCMALYLIRNRVRSKHHCWWWFKAILSTRLWHWYDIGVASFLFHVIQSSHSDLHQEIKGFRLRFTSIKESTIQCLEKCGFAIVALVSLVLSVCTVEQKKKLEENRKSLNKSEDHTKLFKQLDYYWDYLSCDLLALVIRKLSHHNSSFVSIDDNITVYKKDLLEFRRNTTLVFFCQAVRVEDHDIPQELWKKVVEYPWHKPVTLEDVEMFRKCNTLSYKLQTLAMMVNCVLSNKVSCQFYTIIMLTISSHRSHHSPMTWHLHILQPCLGM